MHINRELGELEDGLDAAERALKPGGRLAVVTFHSLEDRLVKNFLRERSGNNPGGSRHAAACSSPVPAPTFDRVAKPVRASEAEACAQPPCALGHVACRPPHPRPRLVVIGEYRS